MWALLLVVAGVLPDRDVVDEHCEVLHLQYLYSSTTGDISHGRLFLKKWDGQNYTESYLVIYDPVQFRKEHIRRDWRRGGYVVVYTEFWDEGLFVLRSQLFTEEWVTTRDAYSEERPQHRFRKPFGFRKESR